LSSKDSTDISLGISLFWVVINVFILLLIGAFATRIYALNIRLVLFLHVFFLKLVRILSAFGTTRSPVQYHPSRLASYQFTISKLLVAPFGFTFFGSSVYITGEILFSIGTGVASFFIFLYNAS
jgi:hypothetical protein